MNNNETIILFKGQSQYDALRSITDGFAVAFQKLGYDAVVIDLLDDVSFKKFERLLSSKNIAFMYGINGWGVDFRAGERPLYEALQVPLFSHYLDAPIYHVSRLRTGFQNNQFFIPAFVNNAHVDFVNQYIMPTYLKVFSPLFSTYDITEGYDEANLLPITDREYPIVFPGSGGDPEQLRQEWKQGGGQLANIFDEIAEDSLFNYEQDITEIAHRVFREKGIELGIIYPDNFMYFLSRVDLFVRQKRRSIIIEKLSHLPLHLFGNGWDHYKGKNNITVHGATNFKKTYEVMKNAKMVINVLPNWNNGPHDRNFNTLVSGAVSLTDKNIYLEKHFEENEGMLFYDLKDDYLADKVEELLNKPTELQEMVVRGRQKVLNNHTLLNRAKDILETVLIQKQLIVYIN